MTTWEHNSVTTKPYVREPLDFVGDIPSFSKVDFYVENYQKISTDHLKHAAQTGHNPFMSEDHWIEIETSTAAVLRRFCTAGDKILDVGVGMGRLLEGFPDLERYGMDISHGYLQCAKAKGINVCMSRIEDIPYRRGYFDAVVTTDVLEHVLDLNLAFSNMLSVLKPGGILICRVPYRENLGSYLDPRSPYEFVHLRNFDEYTIRLFVEKIFNLQLVEWNVCGYIGGKPKIVIPIPKVNGAIRRMIMASKVLNPCIYAFVLRVANNPTEINFVVRNSVLKRRDNFRAHDKM